MPGEKESEVIDRLFCDQGEKEIFDNIAETETFFQNKTRKEQFFFAMSIGFLNELDKKLKKRDGLFNDKDMSDEDRILINVISIYNVKNLEILKNKAAMFRIAERYAHAGIEIIEKERKSIQYGSLGKYYEKKFIELYDSIFEK